jgi:hypothetical protein
MPKAPRTQSRHPNVEIPIYLIKHFMNAYDPLHFTAHSAADKVQQALPNDSETTMQRKRGWTWKQSIGAPPHPCIGLLLQFERQ